MTALTIIIIASEVVSFVAFWKDAVYQHWHQVFAVTQCRVIHASELCFIPGVENLEVRTWSWFLQTCIKSDISHDQIKILRCKPAWLTNFDSFLPLFKKSSKSKDRKETNLCSSYPKLNVPLRKVNICLQALCYLRALWTAVLHVRPIVQRYAGIKQSVLSKLAAVVIKSSDQWVS